MSDKPSYLGLLNAITIGERRGHAVLSAWSSVTRDAALALVLKRVAVREQEHAAAFEKRLCELGFEVQERDNPTFPERLACARSEVSDDDKFRRILGYAAPDEPDRDDPLARVFDDRSIDPLTGALLGRFVCEERDSERQLRDQWKRMTAMPAADDDQVLADIAARIDRLAETIEQLKQLRR
jgi:rubrerythrin